MRPRARYIVAEWRHWPTGQPWSMQQPGCSGRARAHRPPRPLRGRACSSGEQDEHEYARECRTSSRFSPPGAYPVTSSHDFFVEPRLRLIQRSENVGFPSFLRRPGTPAFMACVKFRRQSRCFSKPSPAIGCAGARSATVAARRRTEIEKRCSVSRKSSRSPSASGLSSL
jgi:hypothetical protein